ncbi:MAG: glycerophosphodiester phosphodiesterase [Dehalococcoidia bacterium]
MEFWLLASAGFVAGGIAARALCVHQFRHRAPTFLGPELQDETGFTATVIAHNGGDTERSLALCAAWGAEIIEFDISFLGGRLDVAHTPPRMTPFFLRWWVYRSVPLAKAWRDLPHGTAAYLDVKIHTRRCAQALATFIAENPGRRFYVGAPNPLFLGYLKTLAPRATTILSIGRRRGWLRPLLAGHFAGIDGVSLGPRVLSESLVRACRTKGLVVFAGPSNDRTALRKYAAWGVSALITDDLRVVEASLRSRADLEIAGTPC